MSMLMLLAVIATFQPQGAPLGFRGPAEPCAAEGAGAGKFLKHVPLVIPEMFEGRSLHANVGIQLVIDPSGKVAAATVVRSSLLPALDQAAVEAVRQWEYEPAHRNGVPVYAVVEVGLGVNRGTPETPVR